MSDRDRMLARAEALIAAAVAILYPACGEQLTIGIAQQTPPSDARH